MKLSIFKLSNLNFLITSERAYSSSLEEDYEYLKQHSLILKRSIVGGKVILCSSSHEIKFTSSNDYIYYIVYGCGFSSIEEAYKYIINEAFTLDIINKRLTSTFITKIISEDVYVNCYNYTQRIDIDIDLEELNNNYVNKSINRIITNDENTIFNLDIKEISNIQF